MANDDEIVIFGKYESAFEANLVSGVLQANGVNAGVLNDTSASVLAFYPLDMALVRVVVMRKDLELAKQVMAANPIDPSQLEQSTTDDANE